MGFRNATSDNFAISDWWSNGQNQIAFGRGDKGFVAINKEQGNLNTTLTSSMAAGTYCNVLKGELSEDGQSCTGETVTVNADGTVQLDVAPWDAVAIHHLAKVDTQPTNDDNPTSNDKDWQRTVIFIEAQTASGQDMFIRGGIDHNYAANELGLNCDANNYLCAIPITHNNLLNETTLPWKANDQYLDWYGSEATQSSDATGSPLDWTINSWPSSWGTKRTVGNDGYGEETLNQWGAHWWMLDVMMDCGKTVNGWFELKAFIKNGQGWETDINQAGKPYPSNNHFARCGKVNRFIFGSDFAAISNL
jgi:alpha-amylase